MNSQRYNLHLADLSSVYRPQREWGEGRGVLMVIGHFLVGIAGGTWLLSALYDVRLGYLAAFVLGGLGGAVHLLFLGRPERAFKMMRHFRTSWISRGFVGLTLFLAGGAAHLGGDFAGLAAAVLAGKTVAAIGTVIIIGYMGFCYTASKAVPFWHSPLHPLIYVAFAIRGGIAALLVIGWVEGAPAGSWLPQAWIAVTALVAVLFALELQGAASSGNGAARRSVHDILAGRLALIFYAGTLAIGMLVPLALAFAAPAGSALILGLLGIASALGDFFMKLSTVRAGVYLPLRPPARQRA